MRRGSAWPEQATAKTPGGSLSKVGRTVLSEPGGYSLVNFDRDPRGDLPVSRLRT
jgi:hypothetical protein